MPLYIGLDIGGTKLLVGAANTEGALVRRAMRPTPLALAVGLDTLHAMVAEVARGEEITAFGAAAGGPLDSENGIVSPLHQPEWRGVPLKAIFERKYGAPLAVDVDTNVAALGEYQFAGETSARMLYITLSTGMGGGFLIDGKIERGKDGCHPEIGHQCIIYRCSGPGEVICECGAEGCLEALVSGNGIRRVYHKPAEELNDGEWDEVAYNLGQGLRNIAAITSPDLIVLGGGVAVGGGERLLRAATEVMIRNLTLVAPPEVRLSKLGYDTALHGTIALAMRQTV